MSIAPLHTSGKGEAYFTPTTDNLSSADHSPTEHSHAESQTLAQAPSSESSVERVHHLFLSTEPLSTEEECKLTVSFRISLQAYILWRSNQPPDGTFFLRFESALLFLAAQKKNLFTLHLLSSSKQLSSKERALLLQKVLPLLSPEVLPHTVKILQLLQIASPLSQEHKLYLVLYNDLVLRLRSTKRDETLSEKNFDLVVALSKFFIFLLKNSSDPIFEKSNFKELKNNALWIFTLLLNKPAQHQAESFLRVCSVHLFDKEDFQKTLAWTLLLNQSLNQGADSLLIYNKYMRWCSPNKSGFERLIVRRLSLQHPTYLSQLQQQLTQKEMALPPLSSVEERDQLFLYFVQFSLCDLPLHVASKFLEEWLQDRIPPYSPSLSKAIALIAYRIACRGEPALFQMFLQKFSLPSLCYTQQYELLLHYFTLFPSFGKMHLENFFLLCTCLNEHSILKSSESLEQVYSLIYEYVIALDHLTPEDQTKLESHLFKTALHLFKQKKIEETFQFLLRICHLKLPFRHFYWRHTPNATQEFSQFESARAPLLWIFITQKSLLRYEPLLEEFEKRFLFFLEISRDPQKKQVRQGYLNLLLTIAKENFIENRPQHISLDTIEKNKILNLSKIISEQDFCQEHMGDILSILARSYTSKYSAAYLLIIKQLLDYRPKDAEGYFMENEMDVKFPKLITLFCFHFFHAHKNDSHAVLTSLLITDPFIHRVLFYSKGRSMITQLIKGWDLKLKTHFKSYCRIILAFWPRVKFDITPDLCHRLLNHAEKQNHPEFFYDLLMLTESVTRSPLISEERSRFWQITIIYLAKQPEAKNKLLYLSTLLTTYYHDSGKFLNPNWFRLAITLLIDKPDPQNPSILSILNMAKILEEKFISSETSSENADALLVKNNQGIVKVLDALSFKLILISLVELYIFQKEQSGIAVSFLNNLVKQQHNQLLLRRIDKIFEEILSRDPTLFKEVSPLLLIYLEVNLNFMDTRVNYQRLLLELFQIEVTRKLVKLSLLILDNLNTHDPNFSRNIQNFSLLEKIFENKKWVDTDLIFNLLINIFPSPPSKEFIQHLPHPRVLHILTKSFEFLEEAHLTNGDYLYQLSSYLGPLSNKVDITSLQEGYLKQTLNIIKDPPRNLDDLQMALRLPLTHAPHLNFIKNYFLALIPQVFQKLKQNPHQRDFYQGIIYWIIFSNEICLGKEEQPYKEVIRQLHTSLEKVPFKEALVFLFAITLGPDKKSIDNIKKFIPSTQENQKLIKSLEEIFKYSPLVLSNAIELFVLDLKTSLNNENIEFITYLILSSIDVCLNMHPENVQFFYYPTSTYLDELKTLLPPISQFTSKNAHLINNILILFKQFDLFKNKASDFDEIKAHILPYCTLLKDKNFEKQSLHFFPELVIDYDLTALSDLFSTNNFNCSLKTIEHVQKS